MAGPSSFAQELTTARRLAIEAGTEILGVYSSDFEVIEKAHGAGPVTQADLRANAVIIEGLQRAFPGDGVIAEESDAAANEKAARGGRCWFVDPVDGTQEFVEKNGMFAVQIGLAIDGVARVGVVYAPVLRKLYSGVVGHGATLETADGSRRSLHVPPAASSTSALRLVVSRSHKSKKTELIRSALGITKVMEHGSVGLKAGLVAEGAADLYLHPSDRSYRWDSCGPEAVLQAAGGVLLDFTGAPYRYDGLELRNARGIVGASTGTWEMVRDVVLKVARESGIVPAPSA